MNKKGIPQSNSPEGFQIIIVYHSFIIREERRKSNV
nr:MAG TPA: hypothetical protein [Caudoviricetes sp.]